jgi:hypothetical protein
MNAALLNFFRTGVLGSVSLGMTPAQIQAVLGAPEDTGCALGRQKMLWRFHDVELSFSNERLVVIAVHFASGEVRLPLDTAGPGEVFRLPASVKDMLAVFEEEELPYSLNMKLTFGNQICYRVGKHVDLIADRTTDQPLTAQAS